MIETYKVPQSWMPYIGAANGSGTYGYNRLSEEALQILKDSGAQLMSWSWANQTISIRFDYAAEHVAFKLKHL